MPLNRYTDKFSFNLIKHLKVPFYLWQPSISRESHAQLYKHLGWERLED